ncbi:hypothetical protein D3H64_03335 [Atopobacter sp. AH10]|uniref:LCP family glycopolymer transferase n=1 Tax=Atopobacter sp. AH10 TaxID=2315861 RepID=UPI000EF17679|nr:LCP family protein [Atopobacter sp. AH10]RLK63650.1 hypothetical protein D3H64_03335 [Atopobacter sp. AH10]
MSERYPKGHLPSRSTTHGKSRKSKEKHTDSRYGEPITRKLKRRKGKKWMGWLVLALSMLMVLLFSLGFKAYNSIKKTQQQIDITQIRSQALNVKKSQPFTVLILGVDNGVQGRLSDGGRSDTMILATVNPKQGRTSLLSIPRDSYTEIVGYGTQDKINHAYAFGGAKMSVETVQKMLNVPIDYYLEVNMQGLKDVVNAAGGVDVVSPLTFEYDGAKFKKNKRQHLEGWEALAFTRMRKEDPRGDFGRQERQRLVIEALVKKLKHVSSVTRISKFLDVLGKNFRTNLSVADLLNIQKNYQAAVKKFRTWSIEGREMWLNDIFYCYIEPKELLKFSNRIRRELYMEEITLADLNKIEVDKSNVGAKVDVYQQNQNDAQSVAPEVPRASYQQATPPKTSPSNQGNSSNQSSSSNQGQMPPEGESPTEGDKPNEGSAPADSGRGSEPSEASSPDGGNAGE